MAIVVIGLEGLKRAVDSLPRHLHSRSQMLAILTLIGILLVKLAFLELIFLSADKSLVAIPFSLHHLSLDLETMSIFLNAHRIGYEMSGCKCCRQLAYVVFEP